MPAEVVFDPERRLYRVGEHTVSEQLAEQALVQPWWWRKHRRVLNPEQLAAVTAVLAHLEAGRGPVDA